MTGVCNVLLLLLLFIEKQLAYVGPGWALPLPVIDAIRVIFLLRRSLLCTGVVD